MTRDEPVDDGDDPIDSREATSRIEAMEYVESLLPELAALSSGEPLLRYLLRIAHVEATDAVRRLKSCRASEEAADPVEAQPRFVM